MPQTDPAAGADDAAYADVTYISVKNDSTVPLMFYGWLSDGSDPDNIRSYVKVRIELLGSAAVPALLDRLPPARLGTFQDGGPYPVFTGTVAQLWGESCRHQLPQQPLLDGLDVGPYATRGGSTAVYRVAVWLDSAAPNTAQNDALSFKVNFTGMQDRGLGRRRLRQYCFRTVSFAPDCRGRRPRSPAE